jgi:hypothetical protein
VEQNENEKESKRGRVMRRVTSFLDKHTERLVSRKFLAWITASTFLPLGVLSGDEWVSITLIYIGSQGLIDAAIQWKHGHKQ